MKFKHSTLILIFLVFMFIADGATSLLLNSGSSFYRISIFVRALAEAYFLWLLLRSGQTKIFLFLLTIVVIFVLGTLVGRDLSPDSNLFDGFNYVNKILYFFIVFGVFREYFAADAKRQKLFKLFEALALFQTATMIIGFVFNVKILSAYLNSTGEVSRFGYQGFIPAQNEASLFFIIAFFYFLAKWHYDAGNLLYLFGIFTGALLTGTRVSLVVIPSLALYVGWVVWRSFLRGKGFSRYMLMVIGILILAGVGLWQQEYILERIAPTLNYFAYKFRDKNYASGYEMVIELFSGRNTKLQIFSEIYLSRFGLANYLVGGYDVTSYAVEMDFVDVFARLGIIGAILFYGNYLRCLFYPARRRMNFIHILFVAVWVGVSALAGHVVSSAINASYLAILLLAFAYFFRPTVLETVLKPQGAELQKSGTI